MSARQVPKPVPQIALRTTAPPFQITKIEIDSSDDEEWDPQVVGVDEAPRKGETAMVGVEVDEATRKAEAVMGDDEEFDPPAAEVVAATWDPYLVRPSCAPHLAGV